LIKKLLIFSIIILFIGMSISPSTGNISNVLSLGESNNPPYEPSNPNPIGPDATICGNLSWTGGDSDGDNVTYDVFFGDYHGFIEQIAWNQSETWVQLPDILDFLKTYYWYVVAWDEHGAYTVGPLWSFTTEKNLPPYPASQPDPYNGEPNVPTEGVILCWVGSDPNECDILRYDLYFDDVNLPLTKRINEGYENCWEIPFTLTKYKTYYWRVDTWDSGDLFTEGPVWSFSTGDCCAPSAPIINGPTQCKVGVEYTYTFNSTYESGYDLRYNVRWGDGSEDIIGPSPPGVEVEANHTWHNKGTFIINARATDKYGVIGPWSILEVTVPRYKLLHYSLFLKFLDRYLSIQDLLYILGRKIEWRKEFSLKENS